MNKRRARRPQMRLNEMLLTDIPPFSKIEIHDIREILDQASVRRYEAGMTIFEESQPAERFFLLLDGYVRVVRLTPEGEQIIALHIPSGQLFGIARALGRVSYPATAIAASESLALSWPMRLWDDFAARYDGFATEVYKVIGARIGEMNNRIVEMATQQVEQRVANAVLRLINQTGRKVEGGIEIDFPISRQDLSEMTGTTLHTVSRMLSGWEKEGLVESGRKRIMVRDPHALLVRSSAKG